MFTPLNFSHCNLQLLHVVAVVAAPAAGPVDGAPGSEDPALIKMSNQHTKWG